MVKHTRTLLILGALCLLGSSMAQAEELRFGVLPLQRTQRLAAMFVPLTRLLTREIGIPVRFVTAPGFKVFHERVAEGVYDVVYLAPNHYVRAHDRAGYRVIARMGGEPAAGIVLVRRDSSIQRVEDLRGKTMAIPAPSAWVTLLVRGHLLGHGIDTHRDLVSRNVRSQDSSILAVYQGAVDAAITRRVSLRLMSPQVQDALEVLVEASSHLTVSIAVHPRVAPEVRKRIQTVLVNLQRSEEGRRILKGLEHQRFVKAGDREYDEARRFLKRLR